MTGPEAVLALPDSIRVGAFDFKLVKWPTALANAERCWGQMSAMEMEIRIQEGMPSACKAVDTFWHEVSHAIFFAYKIYDADQEERIVSTLGVAMTALYRDNPWLTTWLDEVFDKPAPNRCNFKGFV